jgi:5-methylcytosine-specific restriction endonuclease McrA
MPERLLCEALSDLEVPPAIRAQLLLHGDVPWNTGLPGIPELRCILLEAQRFRCAYCQVTISGDQGGLRELDHVLPKAPSAPCDSFKCVSAAFPDRRHTAGYSKFRFESRNLVLVCKQCNTNKGSFDPLFIRPWHEDLYPSDANYFLWVHPHFHTYSDHIRITKEWLYQAITYEGQALIKVCKLDRAEVLARRKQVEAYAAQTTNMRAFLNVVSANQLEVNPDTCKDILTKKYGVGEKDAVALIDAWFAHGVEVTVESLSRALAQSKAVEAILT